MTALEAGDRRDDTKWTLVVPCAAPLDRSTDAKPKWLLTAPDGELLVMRAIASIPRRHIKRIVIAFLQEAEDRYRCTEAFRRTGDELVECVILDKATDGPAQTARIVLDRAEVEGPVCIKDGGSFFELSDLPESSFLAIADVRGMSSLSSPGRKSYVRLNENGMICEVVEKDVRSNLVSVGLYGFDSAAMYVREYDRLSRSAGQAPCYVSHVAASAILNGDIFLPCFCQRMVAISTQADWAAYRGAAATLVLNIDGVIFRSQSKYFPPYWGDEAEPITENVLHLLRLQRSGAQLVFMTARPESFRDSTLTALRQLGFIVHALVMNCFHATRYLVSDYSPENLFPSAVAINVPGNTVQLSSLLLPNHTAADQDI